MPPLVAFLDANVLYPAGLRSLLMYLTLEGAFQAKWSADVHEEWIANLLSNRPDLTRKQLERTRRLMDSHAPGALVTGYRKLIPAFDLPDLNDRHVLAAAVRGKATVIVTKNLKDFPAEQVRKFGIVAKHPDEFILELIRIAPDQVCQAAECHRIDLQNPARTVPEYLAMLEVQGIPQSVAALRALLGQAGT
jgi:predicted nucleic acid-binding protein